MRKILMADATGASLAADPSSHPVVLYDGVCGLCNRLIQFVLRRDPEGLFHFAGLQSPFAERVLARHGVDARALEAVCVVTNFNQPNETVLARSDAVAYVLTRLHGTWRAAGILLGWLPRGLRDSAYCLVARHRYRIFGRHETCMVPSPESRSRFLDVE
jgi:predicted DCC family thiol-disulfide oxidoreductase YuxK